MQLCVYCASSNTISERYFAAARAIGQGIGQRGWTLIFGGGSVGLMGMVADAVRSSGGTVIGIIPQALLDREVGYLRADELIVTTTMRQRKQLMDDRAEAFVALPGGFGTLEELLEILTLRQLAYHNKPIVIVNVDGYFDALLAQFEQIFAEGFAHTRHRELYRVVASSEEALSLLSAD